MSFPLPGSGFIELAHVTFEDKTPGDYLTDDALWSGYDEAGGAVDAANQFRFKDLGGSSGVVAYRLNPTDAGDDRYHIVVLQSGFIRSGMVNEYKTVAVQADMLLSGENFKSNFHMYMRPSGVGHSSMYGFRFLWNRRDDYHGKDYFSLLRMIGGASVTLTGAHGDSKYEVDKTDHISVCGVDDGESLSFYALHPGSGSWEQVFRVAASEYNDHAYSGMFSSISISNSTMDHALNDVIIHGIPAVDITTETQSIGGYIDYDGVDVSGQVGGYVSYNGVPQSGQVGGYTDYDFANASGQVGGYTDYDPASVSGQVGGYTTYDAVSESGQVGGYLEQLSVLSSVSGQIGAYVAGIIHNTVIETPNEDLSQGSSFPFPDYEDLYEEVIDASFSQLGRTITFHLQPILSAPSGTPPVHQAHQYNPFMKQAFRPAPVERSPGIHKIQRIVRYTAHIRHGPADIDQGTPLGRLAENEVQLTTVLGSEEHLRNAIAATVDGRRYTLRAGPRPIGLGSVKYLISIWQEDPSIEDGAK